MRVGLFFFFLILLRLLFISCTLLVPSFCLKYVEVTEKWIPVFITQMLFANTDGSSGNVAVLLCQKMSSVVHAEVAAPQEGSCGSNCRSCQETPSGKDGCP